MKADTKFHYATLPNSYLYHQTLISKAKFIKNEL